MLGLSVGYLSRLHARRGDASALVVAALEFLSVEPKRRIEELDALWAADEGPTPRSASPRDESTTCEKLRARGAHGSCTAKATQTRQTDRAAHALRRRDRSLLRRRCRDREGGRAAAPEHVEDPGEQPSAAHPDAPVIENAIHVEPFTAATFTETVKQAGGGIVTRQVEYLASYSRR
jgi:hypothetical protein